MGNRGNQDYYKISGTRTEDRDLANASRRQFTADGSQRRYSEEPVGTQATPHAMPSPTAREKRRAARVRRNSERQIPLSAITHDDEVVRARPGHAAAPPTLRDFALGAVADGYELGARLARRLALRMWASAAGPVVHGIRLLDRVTGGAVTHRF